MLSHCFCALGHICKFVLRCKYLYGIGPRLSDRVKWLELTICFVCLWENLYAHSKINRFCLLSVAKWQFILHFLSILEKKVFGFLKINLICCYFCIFWFWSSNTGSSSIHVTVGMLWMGPLACLSPFAVVCWITWQLGVLVPVLWR